MSDENEKLSGGAGPDFEGHKQSDEKIEQKLDHASDDISEPDFEGHKLGGEKLVEKLVEKLEG